MSGSGSFIKQGGRHAYADRPQHLHRGTRCSRARSPATQQSAGHHSSNAAVVFDQAPAGLTRAASSHRPRDVSRRRHLQRDRNFRRIRGHDGGRWRRAVGERLGLGGAAWSCSRRCTRGNGMCRGHAALGLGSCARQFDRQPLRERRCERSTPARAISRDACRRPVRVSRRHRRLFCPAGPSTSRHGDAPLPSESTRYLIAASTLWAWATSPACLGYVVSRAGRCNTLTQRPRT